MGSRRLTLGKHEDAFRKNLRRVRHSKDITYADIIDALDALGHAMSMDMLQRTEMGMRRPTVEDVIYLSEALRVPLRSMLTPSRVTLVATEESLPTLKGA